jgi:hypothetical protein
MKHPHLFLNSKQDAELPTVFLAKANSKGIRVGYGVDFATRLGKVLQEVQGFVKRFIKFSALQSLPPDDVSAIRPRNTVKEVTFQVQIF